MVKEIKFEILKILLMLMVLFLHLCSYTSLLNTHGLMINECIVWILRSLAYIAVNCYIIVNGYFMIKKDFKFERILKIWLRTLIFSVTFYLIFNTFSIRGITENMLPVTTEKYWFVSSFIILEFIAPILNKSVKNMNQKNYKTMLIILVILFSFLPNIYPYKDVYLVNSGYSFIWFILLYLIGGYLSIYNLELKTKSALSIYLFSSIFLAFTKIYLPLTSIFSNEYISTFFIYLYSYNSLIVLLESISFFLLFKNLKINFNNKTNNIISKLSNASFNIYLIHENPYLKTRLWSLISLYIAITDQLLIPKLILILIILFIVMMVISIILESILKCIYKIKFKSIYEKLNNIIKY